MTPAAYAPLVTHLWPSTVFGALVWMTTLAFARHAARVRSQLWSRHR